MQLTKQEKIAEFRQWLIDHDVQFTEHANGHFQIYVGGEKLMDVWATTERARLVISDTIMGLHAIKKNITIRSNNYYR